MNSWWHKPQTIFKMLNFYQYNILSTINHLQIPALVTKCQMFALYTNQNFWITAKKDETNFCNGTFGKTDPSKIHNAMNSNNWHSHRWNSELSVSILFLNVPKSYVGWVEKSCHSTWNLSRHQTLQSWFSHLRFSRMKYLAILWFDFRANHASSMPCLQVDLWSLAHS